MRWRLKLMPMVECDVDYEPGYGFRINGETVSAVTFLDLWEMSPNWENVFVDTGLRFRGERLLVASRGSDSRDNKLLSHMRKSLAYLFDCDSHDIEPLNTPPLVRYKVEKMT